MLDTRRGAAGAALLLLAQGTAQAGGFIEDMQGMLGVQLDSSRDRVGTGLLPVQRGSGEAAEEYSELGITGKVRYAKTELNVGTVMPRLPILISSPARLLWQTFKGGHLRSQDLPA